MADVYFTYFPGFCFVTRLLAFVLFLVTICCLHVPLFVFTLTCLNKKTSALFRYEIGFYFVPPYVFVFVLRIWPLFPFLSAGLAQKGFCSSLRTRWLFVYTLICFLFEQAQKASALLRVCNLLLFCSFYIFLYSFHCFYFEQALKASALSQDLSNTIYSGLTQASIRETYA